MSPERDVAFCKDIIEPFEPLKPTVHFKQKLS